MDWECVGIHAHPPHTHTSSSRVEILTPPAARLPWRQELHLINIHLINANEAHARARITPDTASYSRTIMRTEV